MFGRKSNTPSRPASNTRKNLSQFGLIDIGDITNMGEMNDIGDEDEDDESLEAELLALTKESAPKPKPKKPRAVVDPLELNKMIQESLRDIPSDEEDSSGEDDPNLMAELHELQSDDGDEVSHPPPIANVPPSSSKQILEERLKMYETAEQNAKDANDSVKARRMARGVTTLKDLLRKSNAGHKINDDDIPPVVSIVSKPIARETISQLVPGSKDSDDTSASPVPPPIPPRASLPTSPISKENKDQSDGSNNEQENNSNEKLVNVLKQRQDQYKKAAVSAKRKNDMETAIKYVKIAKSFDPIIQEVQQGAVINIDTLPPPVSSPSENEVQTANSPPPLKRQDSERQRSTQVNVVTDETQRTQDEPQPVIPTEEVISQPKTVLEALEQRLKKFKEREEAAKKENDSSKARRNGRIVKQYQDAIKLHKAGKPIPVDELPTPPGYPPIPVNDGKPTATPIHSPKVEPTTPKEPEKTPAKSPSMVAAKGHSAGFISRNEKQLQQLIVKQKAFKAAALSAKQSGDIEKAKEYIRAYKGIEQMIEVSKSGIPVDLSSLPLLPSEKTSLDEPQPEVVASSSCIEGTDLDVYHKLEADLQRQIELCFTTRDHFKAIGDVANANRFDQLALQSKKDLKFVQLASNSNLRVPKFHYETKSFSVVQCNTDLTDNDVEVSVVQGVNYNVPNPKEIDTYVKLFFPYPTDTPQQYKSSVVYNTNNPAYNVTTVFTMERNVRACQRIFKRQTLKCEVWSKGSYCCCFSGFFRSDTLIGTANVKLQPLETQSTVHDAYDLMDGRKTVGGKVEIKIRIRNPIVRQQVENIEEKWLIIDS